MATNKLSNEAREFFRSAGKRGGKLSSQRMTAPERIDRARIAGLARQAKRREQNETHGK